nr:acetylxylan esterase [Quercus suber]
MWLTGRRDHEGCHLIFVIVKKLPQRPEAVIDSSIRFASQRKYRDSLCQSSDIMSIDSTRLLLSAHRQAESNLFWLSDHPIELSARRQHDSIDAWPCFQHFHAQANILQVCMKRAQHLAKSFDVGRGSGVSVRVWLNYSSKRMGWPGRDFRISSTCTHLLAYPALLTTLVTAHSTVKPRTQCHSGIYAIVARGTSEPQGGSKLETIVGPLTSAIPDSASNEVVYPADNDFYNSVKTGVRDAQQQIEDYASACPDSQMVIFGYSQGAYVMSIALAGGNVKGTTFQPISQDIGKNVVSVVMFGDSSRVLGQGTAAEGAGACKASSVRPTSLLRSMV